MKQHVANFPEPVQYLDDPFVVQYHFHLITILFRITCSIFWHLLEQYSHIEVSPKFTTIPLGDLMNVTPSRYSPPSDSGCALPRYEYTTGRKLSIASASPPPPGRSVEQVANEGDSMDQSRWGEVRLVEYKDGKGSEAQPGTYDSLETLEYKLVKDSRINPAVLRGERPSHVPMQTISLTSGSAGENASSASVGAGADGLWQERPSSATATPMSTRGFGGYGVPNFPPPGSSGGPIVDISTGAVVGVTRGCKMTALGGR